MLSPTSTRIATAAVLALFLAIGAGCGASSSNNNAGGKSGSASVEGKRLKIVMVTHGIPGDAFWNVIQKGAKDAAQDLNVELDYQALTGAVDPGQEARLLDAALAKKPDAIAVTIPDASAMAGPIKRAQERGIPIIGFNSGASDFRKLGIGTYVGFSEETTGSVAAQEMLKRGSKNAICINHQQGNQLLERICTAFNKTMEQGTAKSKTVVVDGANPSNVKSAVTAALRADSSIDGVYGEGPAVHEPLSAALAGHEKVIFGQLNLTDILPDVASGKTAFTLDLAPYLEGYLPVQLLAQYKRLGISTVGLVETGPIVVTKDTTNQAIELAKRNIR
jgi:simple sugar transport system substrate-binding protein